MVLLPERGAAAWKSRESRWKSSKRKRTQKSSKREGWGRIDEWWS
jgi:hypothetical protein